MAAKHDLAALRKHLQDALNGLDCFVSAHPTRRPTAVTVERDGYWIAWSGGKGSLGIEAACYAVTEEDQRAFSERVHTAALKADA